MLEAAGIVFLFAPTFHPAMRHAAPVRRELGVTTIMNLLGPLANPAGVTRQVLGVSDRDRAPLLAEALVALGARHALVVHGAEGMDEISPLGPSTVWEVREGRIVEWTIEPAALGIPPGSIHELTGGEPAENAAQIESVLNGTRRGSRPRCPAAQRGGGTLRRGTWLVVRGVAGARDGGAGRGEGDGGAAETA